MEQKTNIQICCTCRTRPAPGCRLQKRMPPERSLYCSLCWNDKRSEDQRATGIKFGRAVNRVVGQNNRADRLGLSGKIRVRDWVAVLAASKGICAYCAQSGDVNRLVIEHIVPVSRGGQNDIQNICAACPPCNGSKNAKPLDTFLRRLNNTRPREE